MCQRKCPGQGQNTTSRERRADVYAKEWEKIGVRGRCHGPTASYELYPQGTLHISSLPRAPWLDNARVGARSLFGDDHVLAFFVDTFGCFRFRFLEVNLLKFAYTSRMSSTLEYGVHG